MDNNYHKVSKKTAKRLFMEGKPFYMCPSKLSLSPAWVAIDPQKEMDDYKRIYGDDNKENAWNRLYNDFMESSTSWAVGYYAHYYVAASDNQE